MKQCVHEIGCQANCHEKANKSFRHDASQSFAETDIARRQGKEPEPKGQIDQVKHRQAFLRKCMSEDDGGSISLRCGMGRPRIKTA